MATNPNPCEAGGAVLAPMARPRTPVSRHPWLRTPAVNVAGQVLMWTMSGAGETSAHPGHPWLRTPAVNVAGQVLMWVMSGEETSTKHTPDQAMPRAYARSALNAAPPTAFVRKFEWLSAPLMSSTRMRPSSIWWRTKNHLRCM